MTNVKRQNQQQAASFDLLYQDETLLVLNKPAGLLSVPGRGEDKQDCLASRVQAIFPEALTVHRLDMSTSGIMLMARGQEMQRQLQRLFEQRQVAKTYLAVVDGRPAPGQGEIDLPLINDWPNRPLQKVDPVLGKPALSRYRLLEYHPQDNSSRLELQPVTGRSHQLRVHLQAIGHVILGDPLYAPAVIQARAPRLLLHAESIGFVHPLSGKDCRYHCPAPF